MVCDFASFSMSILSDITFNASASSTIGTVLLCIIYSVISLDLVVVPSPQPATTAFVFSILFFSISIVSVPVYGKNTA